MTGPTLCPSRRSKSAFDPEIDHHTSDRSGLATIVVRAVVVLMEAVGGETVGRSAAAVVILDQSRCGEMQMASLESAWISFALGIPICTSLLLGSHSAAAQTGTAPRMP